MRVKLSALIALSCVALSVPAQGSGFYNMPTNLQQCLGVGFGPGYHAPLLLGPMLKTRIASQQIRRLPHALAPPAQSHFTQPSRIDFASPMQGGGHGYASQGFATPYTAAPPVVYQQPVSQAPVLAVPAGSGGFQGHEVIPAPQPAR